jgi:hypothetical protein
VSGTDKRQSAIAGMLELLAISNTAASDALRVASRIGQDATDIAYPAEKATRDAISKAEELLERLTKGGGK